MLFEEVQGAGQDSSQRPTWGDVPGMYIPREDPEADLGHAGLITYLILLGKALGLCRWKWRREESLGLTDEAATPQPGPQKNTSVVNVRD